MRRWQLRSSGEPVWEENRKPLIDGRIDRAAQRSRHLGKIDGQRSA